MQVSTIPVNHNVHNLSQNKGQRQARPYQGYVSSTNIKQRNSPNFGFSIKDLFRGVMKPLSWAREAQRENQIKKVNLKVRDDIEILSKRLGIKKEEAVARYQEDLNIGGIEVAENGSKQVGLNKVVGRSLEKLELIKNFIAPVVKSVKREHKKIADESLIPNGIIIHGKQGSGKSHLVDSLIEHLEQKSEKIWGWTKEGRYEYPRKDIEVVRLQNKWLEGDTDENFYTIANAFNEAKANHKFPHDRKSHTIIIIDKLEDLLNCKNGELIKTELEYQTKNCGQNGVTWITTTNSIKEFPEWMLNPNRTSMIMPIGPVRADAEKSALLSHFISEVGRKDVSDHNKVLDYMSENMPRPYPSEMKNMVESIDRKLYQEKDYTVSTLYDKAKVKTQHLLDSIDETVENGRITDYGNNPFKNNGEI